MTETKSQHEDGAAVTKRWTKGGDGVEMLFVGEIFDLC